MSSLTKSRIKDDELCVCEYGLVKMLCVTCFSARHHTLQTFSIFNRAWPSFRYPYIINKVKNNIIFFRQPSQQMYAVRQYTQTDYCQLQRQTDGFTARSIQPMQTFKWCDKGPVTDSTAFTCTVVRLPPPPLFKNIYREKERSLHMYVLYATICRGESHSWALAH